MGYKEIEMNQPIRFRVPPPVHAAHRRLREKGVDVTRAVGDFVVRLDGEHPIATWARSRGLECSTGELANQDMTWIKVVTNGASEPATNERRFVCFFTHSARGALFGGCTRVVHGGEVLGPQERIPADLSPAEAVKRVESAEVERGR